MTHTADQQLPLVGVEPRRDASPMSTVPARPTPNHTLRGYCPHCGKWPKAGQTTGKLFSHKPIWRIHNERCPGSGTKPPTYRWVKPL